MVRKVTIDELITSFRKRSRTPLCDLSVEDAGHIKIDTSRGAVLTNIKDVEAFHERMTNQKQDIQAKQAAEKAAEWSVA